MDGFKRECKFCDTIITDTNFEIIGNVLDIKLLNLTLENETQNVLCAMCYSKLLAASNFKTACVHTDDILSPYLNLENGKPLDLKEIYAKEKGCEQGGGALNDEEICRLCLRPTNSDHKSITEVRVDSIQIYIPEISFAKIANPVICIECYDALSVHSSFIKNCLEVQKERNTVTMDVGDNLLAIPPIKTEENEIKPELVDDEMLFQIVHDVKKEEEEEGDSSSHPQNGLVDFEDTKSPYDFDDLNRNSAKSISVNSETISERDAEEQKIESKSVMKDKASVKKYTCDVCDFQTKYKYYLKEHQLRHIDPLERQLFKCGECDYKTYRKKCLAKHQQVHEDLPEVKIYKCDACDYISMHKANLRLHQLKHKNPSEVQKYMCDQCDYKTVTKGNLPLHQLIHKNPSEVPMYMCDVCDYKSFRKRDLKSHLLKHKHPSEVLMYTCDVCDYKNKYKSNLKTHQLRHRDPSMLQMYVCDVCDYKSKHKRNLKTHQVVHKDVSEVQIYRCDKCKFKTKHKASFKRHLSQHNS